MAVLIARTSLCSHLLQPFSSGHGCPADPLHSGQAPRPCCGWRLRAVSASTAPLCHCGCYVSLELHSVLPAHAPAPCTFCKSEPPPGVPAQHCSPLELEVGPERQATWGSCRAPVATPCRTSATPGTVYPVAWNRAVLPSWLWWSPLDTIQSRELPTTLDISHLAAPGAVSPADKRFLSPNPTWL